MKIKNETSQKTVNFEGIKIGEVFECEGIFYLKVSETTAFDVYNNFLGNWENAEYLIPKQSELRVF